MSVIVKPFSFSNGDRYGDKPYVFYEEKIFPEVKVEQPVPKDFPENLVPLYQHVQSDRLGSKGDLLDYRFLDSGFDIFSFVPEELKGLNSWHYEPPLVKDCCHLLDTGGRTIKRVRRRQVLYFEEKGEGQEEVLWEGRSVGNTISRVQNKFIYAVLYRQYVNGYLKVAILHIDEQGSAIELPE